MYVIFQSYQLIQENSNIQFFENCTARGMQLSQRQVSKQQIKTYVRVFPSGGIDSVLDNEYEILGKQISSIIRWINHKYIAHSFNYIFNHEFSYAKQLEHMNIIGDCMDGIDQVVLVDIHKEFIKQFMLGTPEDPGFLLTVFHDVFNQTLFAKDQSTNPQHREKEQSITISVFATQENSNKFIDLIVGQKYIFYSKKDMDEYKDFFAKEIKSMRQFLILLKIVFLRYGECCKNGDPIVFKIVVDSYDEVKNCNYCSKLHIVSYENNSKIQTEILKKIEYSLKSGQLKGEDHGSLANYLDRFFKNNKLVYVYGIPYRKSVLESSLDIFGKLMQMRNHTVKVEAAIIDMKPGQKIQFLNNFQLPKFKSTSHSFTHKDISFANKLLEKLCNFLSQSQGKWKNYCITLGQILQISADFYERERFPISLQIQEFNIKSFLISKVYRLSQTYQMDDLTHLTEKLRTIKNQITIAFKAIRNSKQLIYLSNNSHMNNFVSYYHKCTDLISKNIKILFGFNYRCVQIHNIDLLRKVNIEAVMDSKVLRALCTRLKNEAKKVKQKEQILLRKIDLESFTENARNIDRSGSLEQSARVYTQNQPSSGYKIVDFHHNQRRMNTKSNATQISNFKQSSRQKPRLPDNSLKKTQQNESLLESSVMITRESAVNKQNFFLPKIAIIHRKRLHR